MIARSELAVRRLTRPVAATGRLFAYGLDAAIATARRPFAWRELLQQTWFVASVALVPGLLVAGATGAIVAAQAAALTRGLGVALPLTGLAPLLAAFVVVTAGGTAVCADLSARAAGHEIDGMGALGVDPVQRLAVPRVLAMGLVTALLTAVANAVLTLGAAVVVGGRSELPGLGHGVLDGFLLGVVAGVVAVRHGFAAAPGTAGVAVTRALRRSCIAVLLTAALIELARWAW